MLLAVAIFVVDDVVATYMTVNTTSRAAWDGVFLGFVVLSLCLAAAAFRDPTIANHPSGSLHSGRLALLRAALVHAGCACCSGCSRGRSRGDRLDARRVDGAHRHPRGARGGARSVRGARLSGDGGPQRTAAQREQVSRAEDDRRISAELTDWGARVLGSDRFSVERTSDPLPAAKGTSDGGASSMFAYRATAPAGHGFVSLSSEVVVPLDPLDWSAAETLVESPATGHPGSCSSSSARAPRNRRATLC